MHRTRSESWSQQTGRGLGLGLGCLGGFWLWPETSLRHRAGPHESSIRLTRLVCLTCPLLGWVGVGKEDSLLKASPWPPSGRGKYDQRGVNVTNMGWDASRSKQFCTRRSERSEAPDERQTLLFTATWPKAGSGGMRLGGGMSSFSGGGGMSSFSHLFDLAVVVKTVLGGDWDVHWRYGILTHADLAARVFVPVICSIWSILGCRLLSFRFPLLCSNSRPFVACFSVWALVIGRL